MTCAIRVLLDGDGVWPDLEEKTVHHMPGGLIQIARLKGGMASGRDSVSIRIDLDDENVLVAETSLKLFLNTLEILKEGTK